MEPTPNNIIQKGKTVGLSQKEKAQMRTTLLSYMEAHPAPRNVSVPSPYAGFLFQFFNKRAFALALVAIVFVSSGTAFAAEQTLPSDFLYPVKVHVTEPLQGVLMVSTESKVRFNARIAERRLDEVETLVAKGTLTESQETDLAKRFTDSANRSEEALAMLQEKEPTAAANASADFEAMLSAHGRILNEVKAGDVRQGIAELKQNIGARADRVAEKRQVLTDALTSDTSSRTKKASEKAFKDASQGLVRVETSFRSASTSFDATTTETVSAHVSGIDTAVAEGKKNLGEGAYGKAFVNFQKARGLIGESERLLKSKGKAGAALGGTESPKSSSHTSTTSESRDDSIER